MCYLLRATQADARLSGATLPPGSERLRARWVGAAALTMIAGLAVAAAFVAAPPKPELMSAKEVAAPTSVAARADKTTVVPAAAGVEQTSLAMDDGVPTAFNDKKAAMGECHH